MRNFPEERQVIVVHPQDNVATALADLVPNSKVTIDLGGATGQVVVKDPIPRGHKLAIKSIPAGAPIIKYAEQIGIALDSIEQGAHVHVHNVASTRFQRK